MRLRGMRLVAALAVVAAAFVVVPSALTTRAPQGVSGTPFDVLHVGPDVSGLPVQEDAQAQRSAPVAAAAAAPVVGEVRNWLALDDQYGVYYRKTYTLRGIGQHIEVWVASELNRRAPAATVCPRSGSPRRRTSWTATAATARARGSPTRRSTTSSTSSTTTSTRRSRRRSASPPDRDGIERAARRRRPYNPTR